MTTILSVALRNSPGSLSRLLGVVSDAGINVDAVEAEALGDFGNVRIHTTNAEAAATLRAKGYDVIEAEVLDLELADAPGQLANVARKLADAKVNVVSLFGTAPSASGKPRLLLRVNDAAKAKAALGLK